MKFILACYLLYASFKVIFESLYSYKIISETNLHNFKSVKSPILKFIFSITILSVIYFTLQFRWIYIGTYNSIIETDELLWSVCEGLIFFTFANVCTIFRKLATS